MRKSLFVSAAFLLAFFCLQTAARAQETSASSGALNAFGKEGKALGACPLKQTDVKAEVSGFLARVRVRQEFENNFGDKIEAVYVFPLSERAAVDDMTMRVSERTTVRGKILRREEAREVYETARNRGQVASLLDQDRPNIFTQSIANVLPGEKVVIEISYVETLKYENGSYEFAFPTVVGPRYVPGAPMGKQAGGFAPDTTQVPDASRITPMPAKTRAGHDISIAVDLDAGVAVENIISNSHQIESAMLSASRASVRLKNERAIPNKDFVLRYDVSGKKISDAVLVHRTDKGGFFTLILQPPDRVAAADVTPKEIVFVLDTSGSMHGFPIEKAKEAMSLALDGLHPNDTFNLITFAGDTHILFPQPVPATAQNLAKAQEFLKSRSGAGGTEMMAAIRAALAPSRSQQHVRVVCFMTDGYVGNDMAIIGEIQKYSNARVFSFGIGSGVNRFLLDKMAETGRGEAEYVSLTDDGSVAARRFHERVRSPMLTDIEIDWNNLPVADVYPKRPQDLFSAKPVTVYGRYTAGASGTIRLRGKQAGQEIVREIAVNFPENEPQHDTLATLWARSRVDDLMSQDWQGIQQNNAKPEIKDTITQLGIEYRLLTQFTSFIAVEELIVTDGGQPRRIEVPVEMPEGVSYEGVFGSVKERGRQQISFNGGVSGIGGSILGLEYSTGRRKSKVAARANSYPAINSVTLSQGAKIISGGVINGKATNLAKPAYPAAAKAVKAEGSVSVQVTIDESGNVIAANAVGGHPLLRAAAVQAANQSQFTPTLLSGVPVKITGVIVYNFAAPEKSQPEINITTPETFKPTPEEQARLDFEAKFHPTILALINRLKQSQTQPAPDESKFVRSGKAEIKIVLNDKTPKALEELKKLGFETVIDPKTANFVIGRLAPEKLAELAALKNVLFVAPNISL